MENNYIKSWFHYYSTLQSFELHKVQNYINPKSICFIEETHQLYTNEHYFGINKNEFDKAIELLNSHHTILNNILGIEGESITTSSIDNLKEVIEFFSGILKGETLKVLLDRLNEDIKKKSQELSNRILEIENSSNNQYLELKKGLDDLNTLVDTNSKNSSSKIKEISSRISSTIEKISSNYNQFKELKSNVESFKAYTENALNTNKLQLSKLENSLSRIKEDISKYSSKFANVKTELSSLKSKLDKVSVSVTKEDIGLDKVDNTSDIDKPISNATKAALDNKVDKVEGKGLSTRDFTPDHEKILNEIAGPIFLENLLTELLLKFDGDLFKVEGEKKKEKNLIRMSKLYNSRDGLKLPFLFSNTSPKFVANGQIFRGLPSTESEAEGSVLSYINGKVVWNPSGNVEKYYGITLPVGFDAVENEVKTGQTFSNRIGNSTYLETLPIQSKMYGCVVQFRKGVDYREVYRLDKNDFRFKENGERVKVTTKNNKCVVPKSTFGELTFEEITNKYLYGHIKSYIDNVPTVGFITNIEKDSEFILLTINHTIEGSSEIELGACLNGFDGQVMVYVPEFFYKGIKKRGEFSYNNIIHDTKLDYNNAMVVSEHYLEGYQQSPTMYVSAFKNTLLNEVPTNWGYLSSIPVNSSLSVSNFTKYCRGGLNRESLDISQEELKKLVGNNGYDSIPNSDLNKCRTNIGISDMRQYQDLVGLSNLSYKQYRALVFLMATEFGSLNLRRDYNPEKSAGKILGGFGNRITQINSDIWKEFNSNASIAPLFTTTKIGLRVGYNEFNYTLKGTGEKLDLYKHIVWKDSDEEASISVSKINNGIKIKGNIEYNRPIHFTIDNRYLTGNMTLKVQGLKGESINLFQPNSYNSSITIYMDGEITPKFQGIEDISGTIYNTDKDASHEIDVTIEVVNHEVGIYTKRIDGCSISWRGLGNIFGDVETILDGVYRKDTYNFDTNESNIYMSNDIFGTESIVNRGNPIEVEFFHSITVNGDITGNYINSMNVGDTYLSVGGNASTPTSNITTFNVYKGPESASKHPSKGYRSMYIIYGRDY